MQPTGEPQPQPIRAGDRDRDAVVQRLQEAFAEGRLDDDEFDRRTRAALVAALDTDLAVLTRDLPDRIAAGAADGGYLSGSGLSSTRAAVTSTCAPPN